MTVVTISNQKGGVGKTTTAANLGVLLAGHDRRVLVVDGDPQFALTRQIGVEERSLGVNLVDVLAGRAAAADAIVGDVHGVDVIAGALALAGIEMSLVGELGRERFLRDALEPVLGNYDDVVIDTPPNLGLLTINALVVAELVVAPVSAEDDASLHGIRELRQTLRRLGERLGSPAPELVALLTRWQPWRISSRAIEDALVGEGLGWSCGSDGYTRLACRFLAERVSAEDQLGAQGLSGADVTGFLLRESTRLRPGSVCCHANQLRQLLRYLSMRGLTNPGLAEAVPSVGRWRDAGIPRFPPAPAIERLLESCDRSRRVGVRDFAILTLLARLGLRTVEVCRLELADLHWRAGEIEIDGKGHERARLPLPADVGDALVAYLMLRGRHETRRVFLTERAPTRPIRPPGVRSAVRDACRRAGVEHVPAHRLRHALASQLLREGASLIDISQVLRHKHLESTVIYAKVDLDRLRHAAGPWPGATR